MEDTKLRFVPPGKRSGRRVWSVLARAAALSLALALLLAGCSPGGSTRPGGYTCASGASQYGCFTMLGLSHSHTNGDGQPDFAGSALTSAQSDLLVVPLTCDATCQSSSGGGNPSGYISNFLEMYQTSNNAFIQVGYLTTMGGTQYFVRYFLPDLTTPYQLIYLGPTQIEAGFTGSYPYAPMGVAFRPSLFPTSPAQWMTFVEPGIPNHAPGPEIDHTIGASAFHPDWLFYGQVVYGTSGATAKFSVFSNNLIVTGLWPAVTVSFLTEDGSPPSPVATIDHPTDAGWFIPPPGTDYGGMFYVSCCQPLS